MSVESTANASSREQLAYEFPGDSRLEEPVLYSLPPGLLKAMNEYVPHLFSNDDLRFERRLRELGGTVLSGPEAIAIDFIDDPHLSDVSAELYGDVRSLIAESAEWKMHQVYAPGTCAETLKSRREEMQTRSRERRQGFSGWLIFNHDFRLECERLADEWKKWPDLDSRLLHRRKLNELWRLGASGIEPSAMSQLERMTSNFFEKWNLIGIATWELPIPVPSVQIASDELPTNDMQSMGASLFIPWWMLADQDLKVQEVIEYHRTRQDLAHLNGWTFAGRQNDLGPDRYAKLLQLHLYLMRGMKVRYPDRLDRKLKAMDRAFARYWNPTIADEDAVRAGADAVRKVREELQRKQEEISTGCET